MGNFNTITHMLNSLLPSKACLTTSSAFNRVSLLFFMLFGLSAFTQAQTSNDTLDFQQPGYNWFFGSTQNTYPLPPYTINIKVENPHGILAYVQEVAKGLRFRINPSTNYMNEYIEVTYSFSPPVTAACFGLSDMEKKHLPTEAQQERVIAWGYYQGNMIMPTLIPRDTTCSILGNIVTGEHNSDSLNLQGRVDVVFNQPVDSIKFQYRSGPNPPTSDPVTSSLYVGRYDGFIINNCQAPILGPEDFIDFRAEQVQNDAKLYWRMNEDPTINQFQIMRSVDGQNFMRVGEMYTQPEHLDGKYQFVYTDHNLPAQESKYYYKLRKVHLDGNVEESDVIALNYLSNFDLDMKLFPNPASQSVNLSYLSSQTGNIMVHIMSTDGRVVRTHQLPKDQASGTAEISLDGIAPGIYVVRLKKEGDYITRKLMVR